MADVQVPSIATATPAASTDTVLGVTLGAVKRFTIQDVVNAGVAAVAPVGGTLAVTGALSATGALNVGSGKLVTDASGNLGLGVTPSAFTGTGKNFEIGRVGTILNGGAADCNLQVNTIYNSGWLYAANDYASRYQQYAGQHIWHTAPSGLAGNVITFTQAMTLNASGRLLLGTTTDDGVNRLQVNGGVAIGGDTITVSTAKTPATAAAAGAAGNICWDANYVYVCTATNTWKRAALATW